MVQFLCLSYHSNLFFPLANRLPFALLSSSHYVVLPAVNAVFAGILKHTDTTPIALGFAERLRSDDTKSPEIPTVLKYMWQAAEKIKVSFFIQTCHCLSFKLTLLSVMNYKNYRLG